MRIITALHHLGYRNTLHKEVKLTYRNPPKYISI